MPPCKNALGDHRRDSGTCSASRWGAARNGRSPDSIAPAAATPGPKIVGLHTVCIEVTAEFLAFSKASGNDLSTPQPEFGFPGLEPGDRWCLCAARWREAFEAGKAPRVILAATHEATLEFVELGDLKRYAIDLA